MSAETEIATLLRDHHAVLIRQARHNIYRLPNGQNFVCAQTPSDRRAALNSLRDLRRLLGLSRVAEAKPSKQARRSPPAPPAPAQPTRLTDLPGTRTLAQLAGMIK
jgi:hypothetical protein